MRYTHRRKTSDPIFDPSVMSVQSATRSTPNQTDIEDLPLFSYRFPSSLYDTTTRYTGKIRMHYLVSYDGTAHKHTSMKRNRFVFLEIIKFVLSQRFTVLNSINKRNIHSVVHSIPRGKYALALLAG